MGINRRDWSYDVFDCPIEIESRTLLYLFEAKQITESFLSWYYDWLLEYEPMATGSRAEINNILGLLHGDINEVLRTE